jgi:hypothetical protein
VGVGVAAKELINTVSRDDKSPKEAWEIDFNLDCNAPNLLKALFKETSVTISFDPIKFLKSNVILCLQCFQYLFFHPE